MLSGEISVMRKYPSMSAPTIVLLSLAMAQANGSLVSATADDERPQASRPSWPSTVWVASISRMRGGSAAVCVPG
jgi:hypothetical protein